MGAWPDSIKRAGQHPAFDAYDLQLEGPLPSQCKTHQHMWAVFALPAKLSEHTFAALMAITVLPVEQRQTATIQPESVSIKSTEAALNC
jgi:hypothetical protein